MTGPFHLFPIFPTPTEKCPYYLGELPPHPCRPKLKEKFNGHSYPQGLNLGSASQPFCLSFLICKIRIIIIPFGVLWWLSGLRIWHCYCYGSGHCWAMGSICASETSRCLGPNQKMKSQYLFHMVVVKMEEARSPSKCLLSHVPVLFWVRQREYYRQ